MKFSYKNKRTELETRDIEIPAGFRVDDYDSVVEIMDNFRNTVSVYKNVLVFDREDVPARINWCSMGSQDALTTRYYAEALLLAVKIADAINEVKFQAMMRFLAGGDSQ